MICEWLFAFLLPLCAFCAQSKNALQITPGGSFDHIAMNLREVESLLADSVEKQPVGPPGYQRPGQFPVQNFGPVMPPPVAPMAPMAQMAPGQMSPMGQNAPMAQMAPMAQNVPAANIDIDTYQMGLPLDAGVRLESDDGVWFSSRPAKSRENKDYDTNTLLRIPRQIYEKLAHSMGG